MENWPERWKDKTWSTADGVLTEHELKELYNAVPHGKLAMCKALHVEGLQSRKADRALQLLKKAGLVRFDGRTWSHI